MLDTRHISKDLPSAKAVSATMSTSRSVDSLTRMAGFEIYEADLDVKTVSVKTNETIHHGRLLKLR